MVVMDIGAWFASTTLSGSLLLAVGARAQRCGADHVTASLPNQAREANRIFARLGFAPQVTRRIAPTSLLMRRLRGMEASPLENLMINRRRSLRARGRRQENAYSARIIAAK